MTRPQLIPGSVEKFFESRGLTEVANKEGTPANRLLSHANGNNQEFSDAEMAVEFGGRQCYRSWEKGRQTPAYMKNILQTAHGSVIAHAHWGFFIAGVSRSLTHELIRHAAGVDISQESQRYVDANTARFVVPPALLHMWDGDLECGEAYDFLTDKLRALEAYNRTQAMFDEMIDAEPDAKRKTMLHKRAMEAARNDLPNATETALLWTANARSLRHVLALRGEFSADLEIRRFACEMAPHVTELAPTIFPDVQINDGSGDFGIGCIEVEYPKV